MAATRTVTKKPAVRRPAARKPSTPKAKPPARKTEPPARGTHELHGVAGLLDRMLRFTERAALRIAVMAKRGRRSLLQHA